VIWNAFGMRFFLVSQSSHPLFRTGNNAELTRTCWFRSFLSLPFGGNDR
jgi:hypothetical protein